MKGIVTSFLVFISFVGFPQTSFQKVFSKNAREWGYSIQQTSDGGYVMIGHSFNGMYRDLLIVKTDGNGDTLWAKTYGGAYDDYGTSIQQTSDGGYIVVGYTNSFNANYDNDVYLIKTNSNGDTLWTARIVGSMEDIGYAVQQTSDGGFIIGGVTGSFNAGVNKMYLAKTNANGNLLWSKTFGGSSYEGCFSVQETLDRGFILAGSTLSFGTNGDVYLVKTDVNGNLIWSKSYGGINFERAYCVRQTNDLGFIIAGETSSYGAGMNDMYLLKTNSSGNLQC